MSCFNRHAVALFALALGLVGPAYARELSALEVADRIQKSYDDTKDFKAAFQQEYFSQALGKTKSSSGYVYIKKPGKMRWDYKLPHPKHFVADGTALYVYDPELEQVMVDRSFSGSELTTAITFLWGKGRLRDEFSIAFSPRTDLGGPKHWVLEMIPKNKAQLKKLTFVVERESFRVVETLMEDPGDNVNHIFFANIKVNSGLKDEAFKFTIPEGVEVIEAPKGGALEQ
jgi:outer membrane lipoprotein carrier protein